MSTFSQFTNGNRIKSIQRGTIKLAAGVNSATATIASVDTTKTELRMLGAISNSSFSVAEAFVRISLTSSTRITANRYGQDSYSEISWELTEFI